MDGKLDTCLDWVWLSNTVWVLVLLLQHNKLLRIPIPYVCRSAVAGYESSFYGLHHFRSSGIIVLHAYTLL